MVLGRTADNKIKIRKDDPLGLRAVNCACCGGCGPVYYDDMFGALIYADKNNSYEISEGQFNLVQAGGTFNGSASISINYTPILNCSFSATSDPIIALPKTACLPNGATTIFDGSEFSGSPTCVSDPLYYGPPPLPLQEVKSSMEFVILFFPQEDAGVVKYYAHISGYIQCPVGNGTAFCFSQFRYVGKVYSAGTTNSFSFLGANIFYDDDSAYTSNTWNISFT
jgi:hypothetical protein